MMISFRNLLLPLALGATLHAQGFGFGAVYTLSNDTGGNAVEVTLRLPNGALWPFASFATGGDGTGMGLGSQGAIAGSCDAGRLVVVDPGSDELTMFRSFFGIFLFRTSTVSSGGDRPTSVAMDGRLVYALNADSDEVTGFRIQGNRLRPIPGASYGLSQSGAAGAQVGFSPNGDWLVVTERATDTITVFEVRPNGTLGAVQHNASAGMTPFGFEFRRDGLLVVSDAAGGAANASTTSTYRIQNDGTLATITAAAPTNQTAACWIALPPDGHFAYTTNTGSGNLTGYDVDAPGQLMLLDPSGVSGDLGTGASPIDASFDRSGRLLFVLDSGNDEIATFRRNADGSLTRLAATISLDDGAAGLLAF
ncbi:MAG: beta-propeller fold lactonase family protein [Planctomycetes bacterium]|nr:beta-propeller fold lactonase family protein [Planctomycetota bacterium]